MSKAGGKGSGSPGRTSASINQAAGSSAGPIVLDVASDGHTTVVSGGEKINEAIKAGKKTVRGVIISHRNGRKVHAHGRIAVGQKGSLVGTSGASSEGKAFDPRARVKDS